ncbi:hypothetical protein [Pantoea vagans]|uniref:hypothetical protein n=1 Tax=Pantoea vagans TaxID=470934 RepID=UPI0028996C75|nr:hypothetical protein [Pantoea vagans]
MCTKKTLFLIVVIAFMSRAYAGNHANTFHAFGSYNYCWYWLKTEKDSDSSDVDKLTKDVWVSGYISAINFYTGYENFTDISIVTVKDYIINFCREHPQGKTSSAITELMAKIKEK